MSTQPSSSPASPSDRIGHEVAYNGRQLDDASLEDEQGYPMDVNDPDALESYEAENGSSLSNSCSTLLAYSQQQENMFNHPELREESARNAPMCAQLFRPVVALQPFLDSSASQHHLAQLAAWHFDQYQMYSSYMDRDVDDGGCANYLQPISNRLSHIESTQHLWKADVDDEVFSTFPTDRQIEERVLNNADQLAMYERSMRVAYQTVEAKKAVRGPPVAKKKPAGASTFRHPVRVGSTSGGSVASSSEKVMNDLDDILGNLANPRPPCTSSKPETHHQLEFVTESRDGQMEDQIPTVVAKSKSFLTAKDQFLADQVKHSPPSTRLSSDLYGSSHRALGGTDRRYAASKFVVPVGTDGLGEGISRSGYSASGTGDQRLRHIDPKMVEAVEATIIATNANTAKKFDDISGLEAVKDALFELVVMPILNPEIFTGIKSPSKGLLLFGPPGTGKTLIAKCVAAESHATFFSISASTITSKWIGDGEKMVRALFEVARTRLPAVIFIDEVDSLLSQRSSEEHESSRRMKTEFLTQFDGLSTDSEERLLVIGATNRPHDIDEAARRRFSKRLYIPLPDKAARIAMIRKSLQKERNELSDSDLSRVGDKTEYFSGADMVNLCKEAVLTPTHELVRAANKCAEKIRAINPSNVRPVTFSDFEKALDKVSSSVGPSQLQVHQDWNKKFGAGAG